LVSRKTRRSVSKKESTQRKRHRNNPMPLGPSGCILRASLVGDAHKYVLLKSNVCAAKAPLSSVIDKLLKLLHLITQISPACSSADLQYWDKYAIYEASLVQITQLTGTNCALLVAGGANREFRCEIASRSPSIAKDVIRDQPP